MTNIESKNELENKVLAPLVKPGLIYSIVLAGLAIIVLVGIISYIGQLRHGLGVTGMNNHVSWGLYITTFVYFIGISLAGTLVSAILRLSGLTWQSPITRIAEVITGSALISALLMIVIDMGHPDRLLNLFFYGRFQSPLLWDVTACTTYLFGSLFFLYVPMIPDLALCRDRLEKSVSPIRHKIYSILSLKWQNTSEQKKRLHTATKIMSVVIIPAGVSVHSVTAWIFAMTLRPGWNTSILAPYFVISAFFSGVAMVIVALAIYRKAFGLEKYFTGGLFKKLGWLLVAMALVYGYFNFAELLTEGYKIEEGRKEFLSMFFTGQFSWYFWLYFLTNTLVPVLQMAWEKTRNIGGITFSALLVVIGVWFKRYIFVVPTLTFSQTPTYYGFPPYFPTLQEISITMIGLAGFVLLVALFFRFFPSIPVWEITEEMDKESVKVSHINSLRASNVKGGA